jgi:hypothetical protein
MASEASSASRSIVIWSLITISRCQALLAGVISPVVLFNFFFARHSKSFFLALDHYFDPHTKDGLGGGGGSGKTNPPASPVPAAPVNAPTLVEAGRCLFDSISCTS